MSQHMNKGETNTEEASFTQNNPTLIPWVYPLRKEGIKVLIFCYMTPCRHVASNHLFERICCLHLQDREAKNDSVTSKNKVI